jgi:hypothetical protein
MLNVAVVVSAARSLDYDEASPSELATIGELSGQAWLARPQVTADDWAHHSSGR